MIHFIKQFATILLVGAFGFSSIAIVCSLVSFNLGLYLELVHSPEYCALGAIIALLSMILFVSTRPEKEYN
jgi:hypothetical protein